MHKHNDIYSHIKYCVSALYLNRTPLALQQNEQDNSFILNIILFYTDHSEPDEEHPYQAVPSITSLQYSGVSVNVLSTFSS